MKTFIAGLVVVVSSKFYHKLSNRRIETSKASCQDCTCNGKSTLKKKLRILCGSSLGRSEKLSRKCFDLLHNDSQITTLYEVEWLPIQKYDPEDEIIKDAKLGSYLIIFMPTYMNGQPHEDAKWFCKWLSEASNDFRFSSDELKQLNFAIFGIGDSAYGEEFCLLARNLNDWLFKLKAERFYQTCLLDTSSQIPIDKQFSAWFEELSPKLVAATGMESNDISSDGDSNADDVPNDDLEDEPSDSGNVVTDLEDIVKPNNKLANGTARVKKVTDMLTPDLRKELTKQGYKLIGSHSGVKVCRFFYLSTECNRFA